MSAEKEPLTAARLRQLITHARDDERVIIQVAKPSIGSQASVPVKTVYSGIDWDHGRLIIVPETPLVPKSPKEELFDKATDLILYLATKPVKKPSYEIEQARRIAAKIYPDYMKYQKLFHRETPK